MLGEVMKIFAFAYYYTWFIWPFAFVFGLAHGIKELIETKKEYNRGLIIAAVALLLILSGVVTPILTA